MDGSRLVLGRRLLGVDLRSVLIHLPLARRRHRHPVRWVTLAMRTRSIKVIKGGHVFEVGELKTQ
jgi:hypothetical protein